MIELRQKLAVLANRWLPRKIRVQLIIAYQTAISYLRYKDLHYFRTVSLEISSFCNRHCSYCPNAFHPTPRKHMSDAVFEKILDRLREIKWQGIVDFILYNEPLLDPRLPQLVRRVKQVLPNSLPRVITNGDALTEALMIELMDAGIVTFAVSRHENTNAIWDKRIQSLVKKYPGMIIVTDLMDIQEKQGLNTRAGLVSVGKRFQFQKCSAPENALSIDIDGQVLLCCNDYFRQNVQGNVLKQSLNEIWNEPQYIQLRQELREGKYRLPICRKCMQSHTEEPQQFQEAA